MKRLLQMILLLAPLSLVAQTSNVVLPQDKGPDKICLLYTSDAADE